MADLNPPIAYIGEIYKDAESMWRWRVKAKNGNIVADSAEGYVNRNDCAHMLASVARVDAVVEVTDGSDEKPSDG